MSRQSGISSLLEAGIRDARSHLCRWDGSPPLIGRESGSPGATVAPMLVMAMAMDIDTDNDESRTTVRSQASDE